MRLFVSTNKEIDMINNDFKDLSQQTESFDDLNVDHATLLYGVCVKGPLDFGPPVLKLFRYRKLTKKEIVFFNCARWAKVAGLKLTDRAEREQRRLHYVIVGKPDGGGSSSSDENTDTNTNTDAGPDDSGMSIADLIRAAHADDDKKEAKSSPAPLVQQPAPLPSIPVAKVEKARPIARPARKPSGPEID